MMPWWFPRLKEINHNHKEISFKAFRIQGLIILENIVDYFEIIVYYLYKIQLNSIDVFCDPLVKQNIYTICTIQLPKKKNEQTIIF